MAKKIGSKYWADFYVVLKNGQKIYLEEAFGEDFIEDQMKSKSKKIKAEISGKDQEIVIRKKDILYYGEC